MVNFSLKGLLWTHFGSTADPSKTHTFLERSKSSPINLWLGRGGSTIHCDPFFRIISPAIGRLKSFYVNLTWVTIQDITACLSRPAPLLERLEIEGGSLFSPERYPVLTTDLFSGDLSSLSEFRLAHIRTELPWRNMSTLESFALSHTPPDDISIGQLLDFFESAPRLREVELNAATPNSGAQIGRVVSLACLEKMDILRSESSSLLLDHLLIPVGAELTIWVHSFDRVIEDHLPRSLDNLKNIFDFTEIRLYVSGLYPRMQLGGPNGKLRIMASKTDRTWSGFQILARLDTSNTERLEIVYDGPLPRDPTYRVLLPMINLRALTLSDRRTPDAFEHILDPDKSPSNVVVFPKLEELVFVPCTYTIEPFNIRAVIDMAAARASRGAELRTVRVLDKVDKLDPTDASDLRKHVLHVEYGPNAVNYDGEDSDDQDLRNGRFR